MVFWENMTAGQMVELIRRIDEPGWTEKWEPIIRSLDVLSKKQFEPSKGSQKLGQVPKYSAAYFFVCIASIDYQSRSNPEDVLGIDIDTLRSVYHLDQIVRYEPDDEYDLKYYLKEIVPTKQSAIGDSAWEYLSDYKFNRPDGQRALIDVMSPILVRRINDLVRKKHWSPSTKLKELLDQIEEHNREEYAKGSVRQEKLITASIESLRSLLNHEDWNNTFQAMCTQCNGQQAASPAPSAKKTLPDSRQLHELCDLLNNGVKQIILTGAPGTGKTYIAKEAARYLGAPLNKQQEQGGGCYVLVPFHPSYDYTDFVEGLRPVAGEKTFVKLDGNFKSFCRQVAEKNKENDPKGTCVEDDPARKYFFIIDEINRADLSKVFGELMFCLESDKRGEKVSTQYKNLTVYGLDGDDVFEDGFFIPKNVYIIGTMNDIDRSVESMDFALRRRFMFFDVEADETLLMSAFKSGNFGALLQREAAEAARRVMELNDIIARWKGPGQNPGPNSGKGEQFFLNGQYYIAQGQFSGLPEKLKSGDNLMELLEFVWKFRVRALLREYVRGEDKRKVEPFLEACRKAFLESGQTAESVS